MEVLRTVCNPIWTRQTTPCTFKAWVITVNAHALVEPALTIVGEEIDRVVVHHATKKHTATTSVYMMTLCTIGRTSSGWILNCLITCSPLAASVTASSESH